MLRSERLVEDYVAAGFRKIHLDCSMACADDPLARSAMRSWPRAWRACARWPSAPGSASGGEAPVYVVGTEVPVPGGAHESLTELHPTEPAAAAATIDAHRTAFALAKLDAVWPRVIGLVVQPGVEFDHHKVIDFLPERDRRADRA